jgi:predicted nucleic acid-binding protein
MKIICDTGPIIGLAKIGKISLLKSIAEEVLIPPMVYKELLGKIGDESIQIEGALNDFIRIKESDAFDSAAETAFAGLGEGEKQAIGLAFSVEKDVLLLLDDRAGRVCAGKINIPTIGLIGLLLISKQKRLVEKVSPLIEELRNKGYWLSDEIINIARRLAGE